MKKNVFFQWKPFIDRIYKMKNENSFELNNLQNDILWNTVCEVEHLNIIALEANLSIARKQMEIQKLNLKRFQEIDKIENKILDNDEISNNMETLKNIHQQNFLSIENSHNSLKNELEQKISHFQKRILIAKSEIEKSQTIIDTPIPYFNPNFPKHRPQLSNDLKKAKVQLSMLRKQLGNVKTKEATNKLKILLMKPPFPSLHV